MLKILQILIMLNGIVINANNIKIMNNKENFESFNINCLDSKNRSIEATIGIWTQKIDDPEITDLIFNKKYKFNGTYKIYFIEYIDELGNIFENSSDRLSNAFYGLCTKVEKNSIKMLIKGCSYGYFMIPRANYSLYTVKLDLGERLSKNPIKVNIFTPKDSSDKIVTVMELHEYYDKWLESIKGLPY